MDQFRRTNLRINVLKIVFLNPLQDKNLQFQSFLDVYGYMHQFFAQEKTQQSRKYKYPN